MPGTVLTAFQEEKPLVSCICQSLWCGCFPGGSDGKEPACMQDIQVQSQSGEGALEKGMATHRSIPAWRIPWTEEPGGLQSMGSQRVRHD